jgi:hypothetical protein
VEDLSKDGVKNSGGLVKNDAEVFVLFLHGAQLVLRSGVVQYLMLTR